MNPASNRVLLVTLVLLATLALSQRSQDPRCAKHKCVVDTPTVLDYQVDPSSIGPHRVEYPKCLSGPEWETTLKDLSMGDVKRTHSPMLYFGNWLSGEVSQNIFRMLAEETMGFKIEPYSQSGLAAHDVLCCSQDFFQIESWPNSNYPNDEGYNTLSIMPIGYEGGSAFFVPQYTVDSFPLATAYNAYKFLPEYSDIFPKGYSTPCINATKDSSLGCVEGNFVCNDEQWSNTSCSPQGRYVPPQCQANPSECQEIYMANPLWDPGFFEGLIKNTGLKFILVYLGYTNHVNKIMEQNAAKEHQMFYWWEPDPLVSLVNAQAVSFKSPTLECKQKENSDPTLSQADCDAGKFLLNKLARKETLQKDLDFKFFFESFQISATEMRVMLGEHTTGGGNKNTYNISCDWIKKNVARWKDWVRNTVPVEEVPLTLPPQEKEFPYWVLSIIVLVVVGALGGAGYVKQRNAKVAGAPTDKSKPFAAMFIGPKNLAELWQRTPDNVPTALEMFTDIVRKARKNTGCYECRNVGSFFLLTATDPAKLVRCADEIQKEVSNVEWAPILTAINPTNNHDQSTTGNSTRYQRRRNRRRRPSNESHRSVTSMTESIRSDGNMSASKDGGSQHSSLGSRASKTKSGLAKKSLKLEVGAGIQFGTGRIMYDKEQHSYDYSGAVVDDAANVMDISQRGQTLAAKTAVGIIEDDKLSIPGSFAEFTTRKLNGSGQKCELLQYNTEGEPVKIFEEPNEEDVVDSVMNALQESKGGITQKRITVLCVNVVKFGARATKHGRDASNQLYKDVCEVVDSVAISNRGHVHHSADGQFVITFNAAAPTAGHAYRAGICASQIQADLSDLAVGPVLCGFDSGLAMCGQMPYCAAFNAPQHKASKDPNGNMHQAVVGTVVQNAVLLAQLCTQIARKDPNITCLTTTKKLLDIQPILHLQHVDIIKHIDTVFDEEATPSKKFVGLLAVYGPKQTDEGDCDEWLYELENQSSADPFAKVNACFEALLENNMEKAQAVLQTVEDIKTHRGIQRARRVAEFKNLEEYVERSAISSYVATAAAADLKDV